MTLEEIKTYYGNKAGFKFNGSADELNQLVAGAGYSYNTLTVDYVLYFFIDLPMDENGQVDVGPITALNNNIEVI